MSKNTNTNASTDNAATGRRGKPSLSIASMVTDGSRLMHDAVFSVLEGVADTLNVTVQEVAIAVIAAGQTGIKRVHDDPRVASIIADVERERATRRAADMVGQLAKLGITAEDLAAMLAGASSNVEAE